MFRLLSFVGCVTYYVTEPIGLDFPQALETGVNQFRKRDIQLDVDLGTFKGREAAMDFDVFEVSPNMELLDLIERQSREVEKELWKKYGEIRSLRSKSFPECMSVAWKTIGTGTSGKYFACTSLILALRALNLNS